MTNDEGGTDDEEFRDLAIKDRVATTGQVWMGLTWGCAQCHSHKYDPLSQKEFYQLYAFFNRDRRRRQRRRHAGARSRRDSVTTLVMRELPPDKRRETHIERRGNFLDPGQEGRSGGAGGVPAISQRCPAQPPGTCEMAGRQEKSADGAGDGEPLLGARCSAWESSRPKKTSAIRARCPSHPETARLAGHRIHAARLGHEGDSKRDRDVGDLPAVVGCDAGADRARSAQSLCWRAGRAFGFPPRWCTTRCSPSAACFRRRCTARR